MPATCADGSTVARMELTQLPVGMVRATSCIAPAQSKRLAASFLTVSTRDWRSCENTV